MSRWVKIVSVTILFWIAGSIIFVGNWGMEVFAEVPHLINYQGRLTDKEGQPLEGVYPITFRVYDVENGGVSLWQETQNVNIQKGVFNVLLGAVSDIAKLAFDKPYYLEIVVSDEVMNPRQRITSVGYAMCAEKADTAKQADNATVANTTLSIETRNSDPESPVTGQIWLRTDI